VVFARLAARGNRFKGQQAPIGKIGNVGESKEMDSTSESEKKSAGCPFDCGEPGWYLLDWQ
jgi:hypothetical protein